jgi:hypothetical protein
MPGAMKRLVRILLNAATVLSLVLCVGTVAAWVRSYQARDMIWWAQPNPRLLRASTHRGGFAVEVFTPQLGAYFANPPGAGWEQSAPESYSATVRSRWTRCNRFGFALDRVQNSEFVMRQLACPYWFILLLTAILPAARLAGWRRRRARRLRMGASLCRRCGYDCRATPDRCPECGTPVAAPSALLRLHCI